MSEEKKFGGGFMVFTRKPGEGIKIGDIEVYHNGKKGNAVMFAIKAPGQVITRIVNPNYAVICNERMLKKNEKLDNKFNRRIP